MRSWGLLLAAAVLLPLQAYGFNAGKERNAQSGKIIADSLYAARDFEAAARVYERLLEVNPSADVYYNLGNAYYRMDELAKAILCYERASVLNPTDEDVTANLMFVRNQTVDKQAERPPLFFINWWQQFCHLMPRENWALLSVLSFFGLLLILSAGKRVDGERSVRMVRTLGVLLLCVTVLGNAALLTRHLQSQRHNEAIVMQKRCTIYAAPVESSTVLFVLHEGAKVSIQDTSMTDWTEIALPDGRRGWLSKDAIEAI